MGDLIWKCPESDQFVDLPFQTDSASLARIWLKPVRFQCPHCGKEHETMVGQAYLAGVARSSHADRSHGGVDDMSIVSGPAREGFDIEATRVICDAFDRAWVLLQESGSELAGSEWSSASRTILARRIIEMAGAADVTELRDDALRHLKENPPSHDHSVSLGGMVECQPSSRRSSASGTP